MSLSIYESVVQPILRRLSRSSNDSETPRVTAHIRDSSGLRQHGNGHQVSPDLKEEEVDISPSNIAHVGWDPLTEPRYLAQTGTESEVFVDEPASLSLENHDGGAQQYEDIIQGRSWEGTSRLRSEHRDGETSSNPLHGVPRSFQSPSSSSSISTQSLQIIPVEQEGEALATRITHEGHGGSASSQVAQSAEGLLPADDGMGFMRKRILEIQRASSSQEDKSRSMHALMMERYNLSHPNLPSIRPRSKSPASFSSLDRPATPRSNISYRHAYLATSPPSSLSSVANAPDIFNLTPEDLKPTYYTKPPAPPTRQNSNDKSNEFGMEPVEPEEDELSFGCAHYKRNIKLQCSACGGWYTCRFCHDELEDHSLNRRETKYMLCMYCGCAQKASHDCTRCGERAAWYYCDVCKLWDDDPRRSIYHCHDCGICRVGQGLGKDFFHCKVSGSCIPIH